MTERMLSYQRCDAPARAEAEPAAPARPDSPDHDGQDRGGTATAVRPKTNRPRVDRMPPWKVLLHNDDVHDILFVVETVLKLTSLKRPEAVVSTLEAHKSGLSLLLTTHREHAELLQDQFTSTGLTVTIEPDEQ